VTAGRPVAPDPPSSSAQRDGGGRRAAEIGHLQ
jgi:hypothetical protein